MGHPRQVPRAGDIDVFSYLDYRSFLRDYYLDRKERRGLSYRGFSKRAGLRSPNYLKLVVDGQRNLTPEMAERFGAACGLSKDGIAYFKDLVAFNQARNSRERNARYARLTGHRQYRNEHRLETAHAAYHATWYIPAVRELAARRDFRDDPDWIAQALVPPVTRSQAEKAVETLLALGLLARGKGSTLSQGEPIVSTGPEFHALHIANYHRAMMQQASESIDRVPSADRDISSLTLCLGEDGLRNLKTRLQRFRRELLELSSLEDDPSQVVQLNLQLFPLSKPRGEDGSS
jgi:uncharacterized protein (TIGR02147 family)